jgi:hypothetical protein
MLELQPPMPLFWFHVDMPDPPQAVIAHIQSIVGTPPSWIESMWRVWRRKDDSAPPFVGSVNDSSFKIRRDIRYRNSFLPIIRGRVIASGLGSRLAVLMHIHPFSALFMGFWFYLVLRTHPVLKNPSAADFRVRGLFFIFGVLLVAGGFFPEAWKAKRLISSAVQKTGEEQHSPPQPL